MLWKFFSPLFPSNHSLHSFSHSVPCSARVNIYLFNICSTLRTIVESHHRDSILSYLSGSKYTGWLLNMLNRWWWWWWSVETLVGVKRNGTMNMEEGRKKCMWSEEYGVWLQQNFKDIEKTCRQRENQTIWCLTSESQLESSHLTRKLIWKNWARLSHLQTDRAHSMIFLYSILLFSSIWDEEKIQNDSTTRDFSCLEWFKPSEEFTPLLLDRSEPWHEGDVM